MPETRQDTEIPLIGTMRPEIVGNQLPSNKQVLECYFYHTRRYRPKLTAREAATYVVRKCAVFWKYAGIPTIQECHAITKVVKLVQRYKIIIKYGASKEKYVNFQVKEIDFQCMLEDLFDIAFQKGVNAMKNEVITLLNLHREKGRNGVLDKIIDTGVSTILEETKEQEEDRTSDLYHRAQQSGIAANYGNYLFDEDEDIDEMLKQIEDNEEFDSDFEMELTPTTPKKVKVMTPDITAILDRAKVSDRMAARILAVTLMSVGVALDDVRLSRETLRRNRQQHRKSLNDTIRLNMMNKSSHILSVHWDGKQMSVPGSKLEKIDRLPVLVSGVDDFHQLLGVPRIERGTGEGQAQAIYHSLQEWDVEEEICAMVFDTTSSNTGSENGACVLLEAKLGRDLLYIACRHHVFELLLKSAFEASMGYTSGPDVPIFKRFQEQWKNIEKDKFSPGIIDLTVKEAVEGNINDILGFAEEQLKKGTSRKDYQEFLELVVMFLGGNLSQGNRFRALIPIHHARWMAKAIYCLKIFMFREQFHLTAREKLGLVDVCLFVVLVYQRAWFTAPSAVSAPNNDLTLLKILGAQDSSGKCAKIYQAAFKKFVNHLWYLSEELVGLAFFDDDVSVNCKQKMCEAIKSRSALMDNRKKRKIGMNNPKFIEDCSLDDFVTENTIKFFEILRIDYSFLYTDPTTWQTREDFVTASKIVKSLHVTNDIAERSVSLVSEYNDLLTRDEISKQHLMLVVQKYRESSSKCTREDLEFSLQNYLNNFDQSTKTLSD